MEKCFGAVNNWGYCLGSRESRFWLMIQKTCCRIRPLKRAVLSVSEKEEGFSIPRYFKSFIVLQVPAVLQRSTVEESR